MSAVANVKSNSIRHCAFCKYWNDPANQHIRPKFTNVGLWEFDEIAEEVCLKSNMKRKAFGFCKDYQCKITK